MSRRPPVEPPERPGRPPVGSLGHILTLACLLGAVACGGPMPSGSNTASPTAASYTASPAVQTPAGTGNAEPGDVDGLVVLTGGALSIGTPDGGQVGLDGPGGQVIGFSAANGRVFAETAGMAFAIADLDRAGSSQPAWRAVDIAVIEGREALSVPTLSPRGDKVALVGGNPGRNVSSQVLLVGLGTADRTTTSLDRETNGPPVWIDESGLLLEVLPMPGGTRFLRMNLATGRIDPVAADGYGPAISADGSLAAVASTDGSVLALPAAAWLTGTQPDEGAVVDASGNPFQLAVDAAGRRIAIGYADAAGDPVSIAIFVREGGAWRRSTASVKVGPGTRTMLGWLN